MEIIETLKTLGFSREASGREYLADCIELYAGSRCRASFSEMYEKIAERRGKSAASVMKAMKYAINGAVLAESSGDFLDRLVKDNGNVTVREFVAEFAVRFGNL